MKKNMTDIEKWQEEMKYEIAEELGLLDQVKESGWKSLTSQESGRIGGILSTRKRQEGLQKKQT